MEMPVALNLPLGNAAVTTTDLSVAREKPATDRGFSDHLEKNVDRLNGEQKEVSSASVQEPDKPANTKRVVDSDDAKIVASKQVGDVSPVVESEEVAVPGVLPAGLATLLEEGELIAQTPGLIKAVSVISDRRELGLDLDGLTASGNELPAAASLDTEELVANLVAAEKQISFDPLSKAKESSPQIAAFAAGILPSDKLKFNGKGGAAEFFNASSVALSLDKSGHADMPELIAESLPRSSVAASLSVNLGQQMGATKTAINVDGLPANMGPVSPAMAQQLLPQQVTSERPTMQLEIPMSNPRWGQDFNQRIQWVVNQSMSGAQIRLNPQHMGPVEVRIQVQNDQLSLAFTAQHGATREAIDAALPRLREIFSEQNINMADVDISEHSFAEQRDQQAANNQNNENSHRVDTERELDEALFEQQGNGQQRQYSGLFSDFA